MPQVPTLLAGRLRFALAMVRRDIDTSCGELALPRLVGDLEGVVSLPSDPLDASRRFERFGTPSSAQLSILRRLKASFDPDGLFAPGRFFVEAETQR